jgi:nucleotide-binding universal stress UspA family protein
MSSKHVLIPVDGSTFSWQIIPQVIHFLDPKLNHLVLLRVAPKPETIEFSGPGSDDLTVYADRAEVSIREQVIDEMRPYVQTLTEAGFQTTAAVRFGDPIPSIEEFIEEEAIDLVAMTTHGRTGLSRVFFGSVAQHLLHHAKAPVLLYRSQMA